ncbi:15330_t:CDS:2 [Rhizophagus irregularis]|nr:15330_t:CDS:2 [Rhizophagus irregularis]
MPDAEGGSLTCKKYSISLGIVFVLLVAVSLVQGIVAITFGALFHSYSLTTEKKIAVTGMLIYILLAGLTLFSIFYINKKMDGEDPNNPSKPPSDGGPHDRTRPPIQILLFSIYSIHPFFILTPLAWYLTYSTNSPCPAWRNATIWSVLLFLMAYTQFINSQLFYFVKWGTRELVCTIIMTTLFLIYAIRLFALYVWRDNQKTKLLGIRYIEDYWTDSPPKRCIHVIVEPPVVAISNQSTSIAKITHDMENFSLDNHMNASVPVSLSPNFFPEFLKILKENSEIMKQITLSLEQEKNRKREFEKDTSESMIVEAKAEGHNDVLFTFDPQKYFLGECKSSKSYLGELSKSINDRLLKNPLVEKTELAVQTYFNELMDIFNSKYKNEIITKGKDNNQSYLNKFMPDFSILKDDDTISFRFSYFVKIEYRIKLHTTN